MKILKLEQTEHNRKVGKRCEYIEQNVKDDCMLELDGPNSMSGSVVLAAGGRI